MSNSTTETLEALLGNLESVVNSKSVVGEAIKAGENTIVPLLELSFGLGAGGADVENNGEKNKNDVRSSGGGLGASVKPTAVLVINDSGVQLVDVKNKDSVNKVIDMLPALIDKFTEKKKKEEVDEVIIDLTREN